MIVQVVTMTVLPEEFQAVRLATMDKVAASNSESGVIRFEAFFRNAVDGTDIVIQEVYRDREAMYWHKQTQHYQDWRAIVDTTKAVERTKIIATEPSSDMLPLRKLTIGVDYDGTITADVHLLRAWMSEAVSRGHRVVVVSSRCDTVQSRQAISGHVPSGVEVYLTNHHPKREHVTAAGVTVDIWVDDKPESIWNAGPLQFRIPVTASQEDARVIAERERQAKWPC